MVISTASGRKITVYATESAIPMDVQARMLEDKYAPSSEEEQQWALKKAHRERIMPAMIGQQPNEVEGYGFLNKHEVEARTHRWTNRFKRQRSQQLDLYNRLNDFTRTGLSLLKMQEDTLEPADYITRRRIILQSDPMYLTIMEEINGQESRRESDPRSQRAAHPVPVRR